VGLFSLAAGVLMLISDMVRSALSVDQSLPSKGNTAYFYHAANGYIINPEVLNLYLSTCFIPKIELCGLYLRATMPVCAANA
jgi:hypothetical protein